MSFTIPNAASAAYLPQAEPDSVDIDTLVLGFTDSGVVSGCVVSYSSVMTVTVASGVMVWQGANATVAGGGLTLAAGGASPRFDLIVANNAGGVSINQGTGAAVPVFPTLQAATVPLAAVYVPAGAVTLAAGNIQDKRVILGPTVTSVNVASYATGGNGSSGTPWTGWDTAITWATNTEYRFKAGTYSYATSPNYGLNGLRLIGEGPTTILKCTGAGNAVIFDAGSGSGATAVNCSCERIAIDGGTTAANALYIRGVHHSRFDDILVRGCKTTGAGLLSQGMVANTFRRFSVSGLGLGGFTAIPLNGIVLDKRASDSVQSTSSTFIEPIIEVVGGDGIVLTSAVTCTFVAGTSESNSGRGLNISATSNFNTFIDMDFEINTTEDVLCSGNDNAFYNGYFSTKINVASGATGNRFFGGTCDTMLVAAGALRTAIHGQKCRTNVGTFTDSGTNTTILDVYDLTATAFIPNKIPENTQFGGTLDVTKSAAFLGGTDLTLANGLNSNITLGEGNIFQIVGPTGAFSVGGLTAGRDGRIVTLISNVAQTMTVVHLDAGSSTANKIRCNNQANFVGVATAFFQTVTLQWATSQTMWIMIGHN